MKKYPAHAYPITIFQGRKFALTLDRRDAAGTYRDFSGDTIRGQLRRAANSAAVAATFAFAVVPHSGDGGESGAVVMSLGATDTADLAPGEYVYDVEIVPPSGEDDTFLFIGGPAVVLPEVTRV